MRPPTESISRRPIACLLASLVALPSVAAAHQAPPPPPRHPRERPLLEVSPWLSLGGGAFTAADTATPVFDLRLGGDVTAPIARDGDLRLGPFVEAATSTFASAQVVGGVELFVGAAPRPLRMFYYSGEGVLSVRAGFGWAWREHPLPDARSAPVATLTVAYGYRAPFSLREWSNETTSEPEPRAPLRYMTGARLWVGATVDATGTAAWQLTGGIEFEPVGSFRYLLGAY